jgi:hypothetical protein
MHHPPCETDLIVTSGSQDGLSKAIEMLMEEGDPVKKLPPLVKNEIYLDSYKLAWLLEHYQVSFSCFKSSWFIWIIFSK